MLSEFLAACRDALGICIDNISGDCAIDLMDKVISERAQSPVHSIVSN